MIDRQNLFYLSETMSSLCGIPVRIYEGKKKIFYRSPCDFPSDPFEKYGGKALSNADSVSYFYTEDWYFYVLVRSGDLFLVLGPSRFRKQGLTERKERAFGMNLNAKDSKRYVSALENLVPFPLESVLQIGLALNLVLNGERKTLKDVLVPDNGKEEKKEEEVQKDGEEEAAPHNTLDIERKLLSYVEAGDTEGLKEFFKGMNAVRPGVLSENALRERKDVFIVTATLVSRSAIKEGLDPEEALNLSDLYIQKAETCAGVSELTNLQIRMITDYTARVGSLKEFSNSPLSIKVTAYVQKHMTSDFTLEDIASAVYLSKSRLCAKFKEETEMGVKEYTMKLKIREAQRLLSSTERSPAQISSYLSFSSQSYFNAVFRKFTGLSPREYRKRCREGDR